MNVGIYSSSHVPQLLVRPQMFVALSYERRVCLSVCLSHAGIDSKLMTVGSYGFHYLAAQEL